MRGIRPAWLACILCLLPAAVAHASFDNSHHDMRTYVPAGAVVSGCAPCHGYVTTSVSTAFDNDIGSVGGICLARCHIGDAIAGAVNPQLTPTTGPGITAGPSDYATVVSPNITITYFTLSHGRNPANLVNPSFSGPPGPITWPPTAASTWPYVVNTATRMECTSCHSVHDNRNGAFLWSPLAPISSATAADGFCDKCHQESGRRGDIASAPSGNHPVNVVVDNGAAAVRATNTRRGRRIVIQDYGLAGATSVFDVATAAPSTLIGPTAESTAWNSGGHVVSWGSESNQSETPITNWVPGTTTQVMGCYTCHAAHRTNRGGENNLVVLPTMNSGSSWNPVCVGCHGPSTTIAGDRNEWIVGALTRYGHPVGDNTAPAGGLYTTTVGNLYFAVTTPGVINLENGNGLQGGRVLCTSCHKVHGGTGMALANLGQAPGTGTGAICKRCHNGIGIPNLNDASKSNNTLSGHNAPNSHHVTRIGSMTLPGNILATAETDPIYIKQPGWSTSGGLGDISVSMDCPDCHVFNKTAHNW